MKSENAIPQPAPARIPRATYRLQFHKDFTLRDAWALIPYLHDLGISHIYASPLLKAIPGSRHGYDVCDCSELNPELGTEEDLAKLVAALHQRGMGLVVDIVPNHMGIAGRENRWWWDVLEKGEESPYARYFDIEWKSTEPELTGKVLAPLLGDHYQNVLDKGDFAIESSNGTAELRYGPHCFPIAEAAPVALEKARRDSTALDALLQRQHYRLAFWQEADTKINYRRFFNIPSLAGLRVEDPLVFEQAHALIRKWVECGWLDGLRVDHPDGLRDPEEYMQRLHQLAPAAWIVIEKILMTDENLPRSWPISGTTGYDFIKQVDGLFVAPQSEPMFTEFYAQFTGLDRNLAGLIQQKKSAVLGHMLAAEVSRLADLLARAVAASVLNQTFSFSQLREAIIELATAFPIYRTYIQPQSNGVREEDHHRIEESAALAATRRPDLPSVLFDFLRDLFLVHRGELAADFVLRFQQLTGPAMAKGVEDTVFFCYNRFVALNEVGGDPGHFGAEVPAFHRTVRCQQKDWPHRMLAGTTHDTKRSEDVRARLSVLAEIPEVWTQAVQRWSAMNECHRHHHLPDRNVEYFFYQNIVGAWPIAADRMVAFMEKAAREAKEYTNWTQPDENYESALQNFVTESLSDPEFTADVEHFVSHIADAGWINSLSQLLVRLTAPGVPDIYQGTELWNLSLTDPDNRRPVDFALRNALLAEAANLSAEAAWQRRKEGLPKLWLIRKVLTLRREHPEWLNGTTSYEPLTPIGKKAGHVIAFLRGNRLATIAPRFSLHRQDDWFDTKISLPDGEWINLLTGDESIPNPAPLTELTRKFPVVLLLRKGLE